MNSHAISYDILRELARDASSYLCVGVQEGECLMNVVRAKPTLEKIALCDTWGPHHGGTNRGDHEHIARKLLELGFGGRILWLDGPSQTLIKTLFETFDLSYVDGDHAEQPAYEEIGRAHV